MNEPYVTKIKPQISMFRARHSSYWYAAERFNLKLIRETGASGRRLPGHTHFIPLLSASARLLHNGHILLLEPICLYSWQITLQSNGSCYLGAALIITTNPKFSSDLFFLPPLLLSTLTICSLKRSTTTDSSLATTSFWFIDGGRKAVSFLI